MLLEIAIADAYGAGFEFSSEEKIRQFNDVEHYQSHELYGFTAKYTDDTQMSIAIAELLCTDVDRSKNAVAETLHSCFKRDVREGYSKGFFSLLSETNNAEDLLNKISATSTRNGAAARSVVIGYISEIPELLSFTKIQASVTHNTEMGMYSSCAVALAAHLGIYKKGKVSDIREFLHEYGFGRWKYDWNASVSVEAFDTVSAAFTLIDKNTDLSNLLKESVELGGDTDSTAAIAVGIASCFSEYNNNLSDLLIDGLNEPSYGLAFLNNLESRLRKKYLVK